MKPAMIIAVVLIVAGVLALAYGGFTYTKDSETATLGPLQLTVTDKETVAIPIWAGAAAVVIGAGILIVPLIKR